MVLPAALLSGAGGVLLGKAGGGLFSPVDRAAGYAANQLLPNAIPSIPELLAARNFAGMRFDSFQSFMKANGAEVNVNNRSARWWRLENYVLRSKWYNEGNNYTAWDRVATLGEWAPDIGAIVQMFLRGILDKSTLEFFLQRIGIHDGALASAVLSLGRTIPPQQDLIRMEVREVFNPILRAQLGLDAEYDQSPEFRFWCDKQGLGLITVPDGQGGSITRDFARDYWAAHWQQPSPSMLYEMFRRLRPERINDIQQFVPGTQPFLLDDLKRMLKVNDYAPEWRERLAAISHHVIGRIDIRRLLASGVYNDNQATSAYQDLGYSPDDSVALKDMTKATSFWKPSVSQIARLKVAEEITLAEAADFYSRHFVQPEDQRIAELQSEFVPSVLTATRWFRKSYIGAGEFHEILKRRGVVGSYAANYEREALSKPGNAYTQLTIAKVKEAYEVGYINRAEAKLRLEQLGLEDFEVSQAIQAIDTEIKVHFVKRAITGVRSQFLDGVVDTFDARVMLRRLGVDASRVVDYIDLWTVELFTRRKQISAQKAIDAFVRGLINVDEMKRRIGNLGYGSADVDLFVQFGMQNLQIAVARAAAKAAKSQADRIREAERLIKAMDRQKRQAMSDLARHGSPDRLKKWYKKNLITKVQVVNRLKQLGWPDDDIDHLTKE